MVRTTDSNDAYPVEPNVLDRKLAAEKPDAAWLCDITYIPTREGWFYLASVMDLCTRRIVGGSVAGHMRVRVVKGAKAMATATRFPATGLSHHSGRGVQYCCAEYRAELASSVSQFAIG
jgi:putative transposase